MYGLRWESTSHDHQGTSMSRNIPHPVCERRTHEPLLHSSVFPVAPRSRCLVLPSVRNTVKFAHRAFVTKTLDPNNSCRDGKGDDILRETAVK